MKYGIKIAAGVLLAGAGAGCAITAGATADPVIAKTPPATPTPTKSVDCAVSKCIALTFDDGPGPDTAELLGTLKGFNARATFFVLGNKAKEHPQTLRDEFTAGHEIGNHSLSHPDLTRGSTAEMQRQVEETQSAVEAVTGKRPTLFRPPYGATDKRLKAHLKACGLTQVLWTADTKDWAVRDSDRVAESAERQARRGGIMLFHDIHKTTVRAIPRVLERLSAKGYEFVTVSEVLRTPEPA